MRDRLQADPRSHGTHLSEGLWRMTHKPLTAYYVIEDHAVIIQNVTFTG